MNRRSNHLRFMVQIALLAAIQVVLALTPLGYIPITPAIRATTMHIPVIIGGILLGYKAGAILGFIFGLTSFLTNTFTPLATSFVFSPLAPAVNGVSGNLWSLVICFVPRILIGIAAAGIFRWISRFDKRKFFASLGAGLAGSMVNTILVMGGIYLFFGQEYAQAKQMEYNMLLGAIGAIIGVNGVIEAIVAAVIATAVAKPLLKFVKRGQLAT